MVTNNVNLDIKVGQADGARARGDGKTGGGLGSAFSDVLGNVSAQGRKQPGLSGSGGRDSSRGNDLSGEFRYTDKASERVLDSANDAPDITGMNTNAKGAGPDTKQMFDEAAADAVLNEAAEAVTQQVRDSGIPPTRPKAAQMMLGVLRQMKTVKEVKVDTFTTEVGAPADVQAEAETEAPDDALLDALMKIFKSMSEGTDSMQKAVPQAQKDDIGLTVQLAASDIPVPVTAKHDEAALISFDADMPVMMDDAPLVSADAPDLFDDISALGESLRQDIEFTAELESLVDLDIGEMDNDVDTGDVTADIADLAFSQETAALISGGEVSDESVPIDLNNLTPEDIEAIRQGNADADTFKAADSGEEDTDKDIPDRPVIKPADEDEGDKRPVRDSKPDYSAGTENDTHDKTTGKTPDKARDTADTRLPDKAPDTTADSTEYVQAAAETVSVSTAQAPATDKREVSVKSDRVEMPAKAPVLNIANALSSAPVNNGTKTDESSDSSDIFADVFAEAEEIYGSEEDALDELGAVKQTVQLLGEIIRDAKKELGLTEMHVRRAQPAPAEDTDQYIPVMHDDHVRLSRQLNTGDRTGELDHIMGRRPGISEDDGNDTKTYDAVRMAAQNVRVADDSNFILRPDFGFTIEKPQPRPADVQVAEEILRRIDTMQTDSTEFTMVLNPESLGRITVKLVLTGEKTAVEINAENPDTRALLASRSESLQNMLRDNGVQLERYQIVSEREDTGFEQQSYDGSSKNPYGRNNNGQQQNDDSTDSENFYDLLQSI